MASIIFVTLKDGEYADRWTSELLSVAVSDDRVGVRELTWEGQRSGLRDDLAKPGTLVALRPNKNARYFDIVGKILVKERTRARSENRPAEYKLLVEILRVPTRIQKEASDAFTHNSVLRAIGLPTEQGALPHGIYSQ
jgi:hypothetical protein